MNKLSRLTALLLALIMLLGSVSLAEGGLPIGGSSGLTSDDWADLVDTAEDKLFFTDEGDTGKVITPEAPEQPEKPAFYPYTDIEELTLIQSEMSAEASITASGAAILTHEAAGQWQIAIGGVWANLYGETSSTLTVTSAMMNGRTSAEIRKALGDKNAETGEYAACTQTAVINLIENPPAMFSVSRDASDTAVSDANDGIMTLELANQENMVLVQVIYRIKGTDQPVADAYIGQIAKGSALNTTLTLPRVTGYTASAITGTVAEISIPEADLGNYATFTAPEGDSQGTLQLTVTKELSKEDITIYVEYAPALVNFTVKHMQQEMDKETYKEFASETMTGLTGAQVGEGHAETYPGFTAIWYDPTTAIAADGSTVVEIHYNREYYLLTFDLGGGYGVEPIFAMFGTPVGDVGTPKRAGYTFAGWSLDGVNQEALPSTILAKDSEYKALWTEYVSNYIVAYWLENPNDDGYSYWDSYLVENVQTGTVVQATAFEDYLTGKTDNRDAIEVFYSEFNEEKTKTENGPNKDGQVVISGDGSTVINVYFDRKEYTLKFYYAFEKEEKFYVIGGSTWAFSDATTDKALELYANGAKGQVDGKPELNEIGKSRGYTSDFDYSPDKSYKYHYISFTAKYGADISEKWPCNVFSAAVRINRQTETNGSYKNGWSGMKAFVSAWNGGYRVYYSMHHTNETIKGNYNQLDYQLLLDSGEVCGNSDHKVEDSDTVAYLCFWENGSEDVDWNVPKLFRYNIWVPIVKGQDISALPDNEKLEKDGVQYYLRNVYDTCDNSTADEQTAPAIEGFEYVSRNSSKLSEYDTSVYAAATIVNFYYTRNTYDLKFVSYEDERTVEKIHFGSDISGYEWLPSDDPTDEGALPYPSKQEAGALEFKGWYTTPSFIEGTEFSFDGKTMPAHDVALYARWELVKHKVTFWIDADKTVQVVEYPDVTHRMSVTKAYSEAEYYKDPKKWMDEHPDQSGKYNLYNFDGWYYMDGGVEKRFDIKNMPIKTDMDIYAKWTSDTPVEFVFYYQHVEKMGTTEYLAEPYIGKALPFTPVTMSAKIGDDLTLAPKVDKSGYIPAVNSHTIILDVDPAKNVFTFYYQESVNVKYTVQYLEAEYKDVDGKQVLVPIMEGDKPKALVKEKTVSTEKAVVTENYVPVPEYMPQATQLRLIVSMKEEMNVIQFLYLPNTKGEAPYNVSHYLVDHAGNKYLRTSETNKTDKIDNLVKVDKLRDEDIPGYTFAYAKVAVPELKDGIWEDVLHDVPATQITDTHVMYKLPAAGMHVYLYYEPIKYPVVIQYLDSITEQPLEDADGQEIPFEKVNLPYESIVKTEAHYKEIPDYRYVRMDPLEHKVRIEPDPDNPTVNVLKILYTLDVANIKISKTITESVDKDAPQLTEAEWNTAFPFTVKLTDKDGKTTTKVKATIAGKETELVVDMNGAVTFELRNGESATLHGLWVGTKYEISEQEQKIFKTNYSVEASGELTAMGMDMDVTNMYPKYIGELIIKKDGLTAGESAIVKAEVGSDTYYLVLNATNGYTATISGIKPNTKYEVSEVTNWTWQYEPDVKSATGTITEKQAKATVTINNTKETDKWLHDESHVENNFGTGKSIGVNE